MQKRTALTGANKTGIEMDERENNYVSSIRGSAGIILAGGGTGGHIFPAVAIANALRRIEPGLDILFVGAKGKMEMEKVPQSGYAIEGIDIAGFNRSSLIKNWGLPFKLIQSFFQVRRIVDSFKPNAVIGVGGYSSFPVLRYAQAKAIPTFIHESNSFAGKSNKLLAKKVIMAFVASDGMEKFFPEVKIRLTGNPVRSSIVNSRVSRDQGIQYFGLDPSLKTVFSTGGSLGARGINEAVEAGLDEFENNRIQLIWQTGRPFAERAKEICSGKWNIWTGDFVAEMEYAYAAADLVISRAGAMSISELCVAKKPVVFVPFPYAAEDHQTVNAQNLLHKNAALMIRDNEAKEKLIPAVIALALDGSKRQELKDNIGKLAITDADKRIAEEVLKAIAK
jgi:UDP-N-acetylglucosamine--N-acetylmuramyl-(pentapeptide) pyrophosphoryl-undecaprenol N-acetylglucosamine transferase